MGGVPKVEEILTSKERTLLARLVAQSPHPRRVCLRILVEKGMPCYCWLEDLTQEVHLEAVWKLLQKFHILEHLPLLPRLDALLQISPDTHRENHGDLSIPKVASHCCVLSVSRCIDFPKVRHRLGNAADEGREQDHGADDHEHTVSPLRRVCGDHLHGCGSELGQTPVQTGGISVANAFVSCENIHPGGGLRQHISKTIPAASHKMVDYHDEDNELDNMQDGE
mmetsp:Transcript_26894/g.49432  ORF Transcript_26894/g.49432 Transcript_26894/m.49432 type:complete len:224 (+) Transcript_26894:139-810(+)